MISGYGSLTKPLPGARIDPAHPLSKGLVGCWLLNEGSGSRANDISGHGNHGTLVNMSPNAQDSGWGGSEFGGGLSFDRIDDYVDCGGGFESVYNNNALTFAVWVKISDQSVDQRIGGRYGLLVPERSFLLWLDVDDGGIGYASLVVTESGLDPKLGESVSSLILNQLQFVVVTWDGTNSVLYVDGNVIGSVSCADQIQAATAQNVQFASFRDCYNIFKGAIDSAYIYNRAILAAEVKQLYEDPFCNILSPRRWYVPAAGPSGVIMNQFQNSNIGADLFNGALQ